jgi:hypothetical protein
MLKLFYNTEEKRLRAFWRLLIQGILFFGFTLILQIFIGVG